MFGKNSSGVSYLFCEWAAGGTIDNALKVRAKRELRLRQQHEKLELERLEKENREYRERKERRKKGLLKIEVTTDDESDTETVKITYPRRGRVKSESDATSLLLSPKRVRFDGNVKSALKKTNSSGDENATSSDEATGTTESSTGAETSSRNESTASNSNSSSRSKSKTQKKKKNESLCECGRSMKVNKEKNTTEAAIVTPSETSTAESEPKTSDSKDSTEEKAKDGTKGTSKTEDSSTESECSESESSDQVSKKKGAKKSVDKADDTDTDSEPESAKKDTRTSSNGKKSNIKPQKVSVDDNATDSAKESEDESPVMKRKKEQAKAKEEKRKSHKESKQGKDKETRKEEGQGKKDKGQTKEPNSPQKDKEQDAPQKDKERKDAQDEDGDASKAQDQTGGGGKNHQDAKTPQNSIGPAQFYNGPFYGSQMTGAFPGYDTSGQCFPPSMTPFGNPYLYGSYMPPGSSFMSAPGHMNSTPYFGTHPMMQPVSLPQMNMAGGVMPGMMTGPGGCASTMTSLPAENGISTAKSTPMTRQNQPSLDTAADRSQVNSHSSSTVNPQSRWSNYGKKSGSNRTSSDQVFGERINPTHQNHAQDHHQRYPENTRGETQGAHNYSGWDAMEPRSSPRDWTQEAWGNPLDYYGGRGEEPSYRQETSIGGQQIFGNDHPSYFQYQGRNTSYHHGGNQPGGSAGIEHQNDSGYVNQAPLEHIYQGFSNKQQKPRSSSRTMPGSWSPMELGTPETSNQATGTNVPPWGDPTAAQSTNTENW